MGEGSPIPTLIVFGGLPGAGKTTLARAVARYLGATYLRIDQIEQELRALYPSTADLEDQGYRVAYKLAQDNLRLGNSVVADCANWVEITRDVWLAVAKEAGTPAIEVEIVCSDRNEHRRRIETRVSDIPGLVLPIWDAILAGGYEAWTRPHLVIDTASRSAEDCVAELLKSVSASV